MTRDEAIRTVVDTAHVENVVGKIYRAASDEQFSACTSRWSASDLPDEVRAAQQRYTAARYTYARYLFMSAYRFEKAMEVLR